MPSELTAIIARQGKRREDIARWGTEYTVGTVTLDDIDYLLAELTALRTETDRLRGINPDIDTQDTWQKELPYLFRSWTALYVENQRLRDEYKQRAASWVKTQCKEYPFPCGECIYCEVAEVLATTETTKE